jgi:hypothetical protein
MQSAAKLKPCHFITQSAMVRHITRPLSIIQKQNMQILRTQHTLLKLHHGLHANQQLSLTLQRTLDQKVDKLEDEDHTHTVVATVGVFAVYLALIYK